MPRRVSLPSADDLFRPTVVPDVEPHPAPAPAASSASASAPGAATKQKAEPGRKPSGRVRHDEKMTVYITSDELMEIEHARLALRAGHGVAVDRGRLVRTALSIVLADFDQNGEDSVLVQHLQDS